MTCSPALGPKWRRSSFIRIFSYVCDWLILIALAIVAFILGDIEPIKRPFDLDNPAISFPFIEHETVPVSLLNIFNAIVPAAVIFVVTLIFVPGLTVPKGTPKSMIWKRRLWELHIGWLGMALSIIVCMFVTRSLKTMFGQPRPDMLSRCQPDFVHANRFVVGTGKLVTAAICTTTDKSKLDDGFRSFPSGHASSAAAGLIYLSLFLASKFTVAIPVIAPASYLIDISFTAFPSRIPSSSATSAATSRVGDGNHPAEAQIASHIASALAVRRQAAAPPLYLLGVVLLPFFGAIFIGSSRWFDYRHHAFDIGFGFIIGTVSAFFSFRFYHMPIGHGAGWAWGPRSRDKAFWAGIGSYSYATDRQKYSVRADEEEEMTETSRGRAGDVA